MTSQGEANLIDYANAQIGRPFIWADTSCGALIFGALDALRGTNLKQTNTVQSVTSIELARESAEQNTGLKFLKVNEFKEVPLDHATQGDIIYAKEDGLECFHVCLGLMTMSSSEAQGVHLIKTKTLTRLLENRGKAFRCQL